MRLHEFEAKQQLRTAGIHLPAGERVFSSGEAKQAAARIGGPVMVKAQVLVGGRGKAGGILRAETPDAAAVAAEEILAGPVRGQDPEGVLVEAAVDVGLELYVGVTVDAEAGRPVLVLSACGGVEIEETAASQPDAVLSHLVDPVEGISPEDATELVQAAGLTGPMAAAVAETVCRLYSVFADCEAVIAEVNPLVIPADGGPPVAVDAVLEVDDAALFRQPDLKRIADERPAGPGVREAQAYGMTFVGLEGRIGLICSGAGLGMATMDLIGEQSRPANFLETGGGITRELMAEATRIVLSQPGLEAVLLNVYGGINPIHEGAKGVADVLAQGATVPVVAKALGNFQEETWATLEAAGVTVVRDVETERAVEEVLRKAEGGVRNAEGRASE